MTFARRFNHKAGLDCCTLGVRIASVSLRYSETGKKLHGPFSRCSPGFGQPKGSRRRRLRVGGDKLRPVADGPFARRDRLARLEAILFLAQEPLASRKLAQLADLADGTEARSMVRELNRLFDAEGCSFHVAEVAGGFQLMSRTQFSPWLRRLHSAALEVRLSGPALETLTVVAYRQPVLRAAIEAIRGVQCGEILRQLMERDLVKIVGRSEDLGRPFLYGTTKRFLQVFGLRWIDELPRREWFEAAESEANVGSPKTAKCEASTTESSQEHVSNKLEEE